MNTITAGNWKGILGLGLAPRELEATLYAAAELTAKEIARVMGIAPTTVAKRLEAARFKLGARTVRGLVLEAFKRQIIAPLGVAAVAVLLCLDHQPAANRAPNAPRRIEMRLSCRAPTSAWVA